MDVVDFLHHENSPTWTGVEPTKRSVYFCFQTMALNTLGELGSLGYSANSHRAASKNDENTYRQLNKAPHSQSV
ncbi:hypothetical protein TNCV_2037531 [Trichonephila clavipes]|nr:hypothetical protein TNCV_2037531 [Trichonephila clavipes]